ncbi:antibiotic biosynthesis monooxygenase [Flavobacteriaceae bacterium]|jgi:heme-degrading monooxygenase HmoA|nr:antibiotic biosynthesis monooxygenase [Flavobacteriaceae bacterium]MDC1259289.1 antibiotic biosynthesis monooxygenase [Flavobacteriaceae bacterium]MDG1433169.1 antibiotic biosynthesis monooxygenase [Saprospiraceae bacterium]
MIANTPHPPYYAVIFSSIRSQNVEGYSEVNALMNQLVFKQDGFLGMEAVQSELGVTISYWRDLESIKRWKENLDHQDAQIKGRKTWYSHYKVRIAKVERDYAFTT